MPAPMVTGWVPWKTAVSAIVAVASALRGAFGGPVGVDGEEERCVFGGGLRVAIVVWRDEVDVVLEFKLEVARRRVWVGDCGVCYPRDNLVVPGKQF